MGYHEILCNIENCDYTATSKKELKKHKKDVHVS